MIFLSCPNWWEYLLIKCSVCTRDTPSKDIAIEKDRIKCVLWEKWSHKSWSLCSYTPTFVHFPIYTFRCMCDFVLRCHLNFVLDILYTQKSKLGKNESSRENMSIFKKYSLFFPTASSILPILTFVLSEIYDIHDMTPLLVKYKCLRENKVYFN